MDEREGISVFKAKWIVPVARQPIEDGYIVVKDGKIYNVTSELGPEFSSFKVIDTGNSVIFPAFINTHVHLEHLSPLFVPVDYKEYLYKIREAELSPSSEKEGIVKENLDQCYKYGTIALADFSSDGTSVPLLLESPLFARVFLEVKSFKTFEAEFTFRSIERIMATLPLSRKVTCHMTPSSLAFTSEPLIRKICHREKHIAMHFAFTEHETEFLLEGKGLIKQYLLSIGDFDYDWQRPGKSSARYMLDNFLFTKHNLLIHCTDLIKSEIHRLREIPEKINISISPRVYDSLSISHPNVDELMSDGFNICLGTEGRIVNSDLDLRKEMVRCVSKYGVPYEFALKFATLNGAYAIGFHKEVGSIEPGKIAKCLIIRDIDEDIDDPYVPIFDLRYKVEWLV
ncbi:MAG: hypothetical protein DRP88_05420 [Candidatus Neomarinimicrobiota bacterium]|nr:amidohydrolase family protein [Candidatus Neomarinimicrobiota bacterium]RKY46994.1 MAG: hypothetical protein DRP88_05420 [Candidatus Neomarinimicrobiota bacterium]